MSQWSKWNNNEQWNWLAQIAMYNCLIFELGETTITTLLQNNPAWLVSLPKDFLSKTFDVVVGPSFGLTLQVYGTNQWRPVRWGKWGSGSLVIVIK